MAQVRARRTGKVARKLGLAGRAGVAVALAAVLVGVGAVAVVRSAGGSVTVERAAVEEPVVEAEAEGEAVAPPATVFVHVDGAVASPGVYELAEGSRVVDSIAAAGGLADGADTSGLNLAALVGDGEKVYVPVEGEAAADGGAGAPVGGGGSTSGAAALVNLNTATADELCELPGIGEATAEAIIEDRSANGPFSTVEDLMRVSGIGEKKFAKLEGKICV